MSELSYEETAKALAKHRGISLAEAEAVLAGRNDLLDPAATLASAAAFDEPDSFESSLIRSPWVKGRVVALDPALSPKMEVQRQEMVEAAKAEGDRYREMSRATSMHIAGEG